MHLMIACRAIDKMAGGVERQAIALANEMVNRGHDVTLFTLDTEGAEAFYNIDAKVQWIKLGMGNPKFKASLKLRLQRMARVRAIFKAARPDVVLAFQQGMFLTLRLYTVCLGVPIVAAERESPFRYDFIREGKYRNFIFQSFRLARHITVQCDSYIDAYPLYLRKKIKVVPNAIAPATRLASLKTKAASKKKLLCVGRLGYQKNQIVLIEAFAKIAADLPDWKLVLAGDGEGKSAIEAKIREYSLEKDVQLLGAVKDVSKLYQSAHLFCLPSLWEGFPNALGEALAHGLPCVGYQDCGGVRDLIEDGKNGLLAEGNGNVSTLSVTLASIMKDDNLRLELGANAAQSMKPFLPVTIYNQWETFLMGVSGT